MIIKIQHSLFSKKKSNLNHDTQNITLIDQSGRRYYKTPLTLVVFY